MERLSCSPTDPYVALEAAIHVGRYAPALALCAGKRVLDVASGEGYGSYLLAVSGAVEVQGLDVSADAIAKAQSLFQHGSLQYNVGKAETLNTLYPEKKFDLIVSLETIEHLDDPASFLRALRRVATDDATIIISCPNDHWYYSEDNSNPYHVRKYTLAEFQDLTTRELGDGVRWFFGTGALGFVSIPIDHPDTAATGGQGASKYVDVHRIASTFVCRPDPEDAVGVETSSYFVGVWGPGADTLTGGAVYPLSMDRLFTCLSGQQTKDALNSETQRAGELEKELQKVREDLRIAMLQANALRRENDILSGSVARLTEQEQKNEQLVEALRARLSRFDSIAARVPTGVRRLASRILSR